MTILGISKIPKEDNENELASMDLHFEPINLPDQNNPYGIWVITEYNTRFEYMFWTQNSRFGEGIIFIYINIS